MNNATQIQIQIDELRETLRKLDSIISLIWHTAESKGLCYETLAGAADVANDLVTTAEALVEGIAA